MLHVETRNKRVQHFLQSIAGSAYLVRLIRVMVAAQQTMFAINLGRGSNIICLTEVVLVLQSCAKSLYPLV